MNEIQKQFVEHVPDEIADNLMVGFVAKRMRQKLAEKREEGRGGWFRSECSETALIDMLNQHIQKGDMVDILNFAAMILVKRELGDE